MADIFHGKGKSHHKRQCTLQLGQTTFGIHTGVAKCIEVDGGILELLL
jgi:hypothetical protein